MAKKILYTATQVTRFRERLHKEHQKEMQDYGARRYEQGVAAGRRAS